MCLFHALRTRGEKKKRKKHTHTHTHTHTKGERDAAGGDPLQAPCVTMKACLQKILQQTGERRRRWRRRRRAPHISISLL